MIYKTLLISLLLPVLMCCQNQTGANTNKNTSTKVSTEIPGTMSKGLPPDKAAIEQARKEQNSEVNTPNTIYLNEGENKFSKENKLNITFKKMVEDSRCPEGVNCIWAGVATAEVEVMGVSTRPSTVRLSTMQDATRGYSTSQHFKGYTLDLISVTPTPTDGQNFKNMQGKYRIAIKISKDTGSGETPGGTTTK